MTDRLGEFALIDAFRARLPRAHAGVVVESGDDAAVVRPGGALSVVSVDTTVDGVHARLDLGDDPLATARDFGWRALTTALSDLAACGVGPGRGASATKDQWTASGIEAYVAVTLPAGLSDDCVLAIADGLADAARTFGVSVVGGDVTSGPAVVVSATVVGWLDDRPLTRSGARPGDLIGITGPIGAAGAGLALTIGEVTVTDRLDSATAGALLGRYARPRPQLAEGAALRDAGATAAIDCSDGLHADLRHLARSSGVTITVDATAVPIARGVAAIARELAFDDPLAYAAGAGEDFVLLVAVPPDRRDAAEAAGVIAWIGVAFELRPETAATVTGLPPTNRAGHDHRR